MWIKKVDTILVLLSELLLNNPKEIVYILAVVSLIVIWLGVVGIVVILQLIFGEDMFLLRCAILYPVMVLAVKVTEKTSALIKKISNS